MHDRRRLRVVAGAWLRDGRVLACRRGPGRSQAGLWELPGGKVEAGESDAAALARELGEELRVAVVVGEPLAESVHDYPELTVHLVAYLVRGEGEPDPTEHDELRWLSAAELHTVRWAPADLPLLEALAARLADRS